MNYKQQAEIIREQRDIRLITHLLSIRPYIQKIPKEKIEKVIDSTATELAQMLNKGETTSVELVNIFAYRAGTIGHQLTAITEDNFVEALKMAKQCDQKRKTNGWKNGVLVGEEVETAGKDHFSPFFGVPISIKDTIDMKGFASTIGCVNRYYIEKEKDGEIVTVLKNSGMIPFVRTNVPQLCMSYECNNLLWGDTQNPWNRLRTPGGSSGGEAALIASRSSPIGLGGDIGGSLRIPAEFCGLYTLKPTSQRITSGGHTNFSPSIDGQINIRPTMGPLARSVDDLSTFLSILMNETYYDNQIIDAYRKLEPFDAKMFKSITTKNSNFRIGYYESFEIFPSSFASRRAVREVIKILKGKGHTVVPVKIPRVQELSKMLVATMVAEGGLEGYQEILDGQPIAKQYDEVRKALLLPRIVHWTLIKFLQRISPRMAFTLSEVKKLSTHQYLCLANLQKQLKQQFLQMWKKENLDFIIAPGFGTQAPLIGGSCKISILPAMYANIYNVLDMTVGSLPVTKVRLEEEKYPNQYKDGYERATQESLKGTEGLPVGVQVVSLPWRDEQVLGMMKLLEDEIRFREKYSYPI